jgi:hypothetical protein
MWRVSLRKYARCGAQPSRDLAPQLYGWWCTTQTQSMRAVTIYYRYIYHHFVVTTNSSPIFWNTSVCLAGRWPWSTGFLIWNTVRRSRAILSSVHRWQYGTGIFISRPGLQFTSVFCFPLITRTLKWLHVVQSNENFALSCIRPYAMHAPRFLGSGLTVCLGCCKNMHNRTISRLNMLDIRSSLYHILGMQLKLTK